MLHFTDEFLDIDVISIDNAYLCHVGANMILGSLLSGWVLFGVFWNLYTLQHIANIVSAVRNVSVQISQIIARINC